MQTVQAMIISKWIIYDGDQMKNSNQFLFLFDCSFFSTFLSHKNGYGKYGEIIIIF